MLQFFEDFTVLWNFRMIPLLIVCFKILVGGELCVISKPTIGHN